MWEGVDVAKGSHNISRPVCDIRILYEFMMFTTCFTMYAFDLRGSSSPIQYFRCRCLKYPKIIYKTCVFKRVTQTGQKSANLRGQPVGYWMVGRQTFDSIPMVDNELTYTLPETNIAPEK